MLDTSHLTVTGTVAYTGYHVMASLYGVKHHNDLDLVRETMLESVRACDATILSDNFHYFGESGLTGVILLSESHASCHSWWEAEDLLVVDFFMCGTSDPFKALHVLRDRFQPTRTVIDVVVRGMFSMEPEEKDLTVYSLEDKETGQTTHVSMTPYIESVRKDGNVRVIATGLTPELAVDIAIRVSRFYGYEDEGGSLVRMGVQKTAALV